MRIIRIDGGIRIGAYTTLRVVDDFHRERPLSVYVTGRSGAHVVGVYYKPMGRGNSIPVDVAFETMGSHGARITEFTSR